MRIITVTAKGCKLKTPAGMSTRPTSDRMKESLFSILGEDVLENRVLDIFAGTGGLGLEALSRGAASAVFIDKATADIIAFNAQHTNLADKCRILAGDVFVHLQRLEQQGEKFNMVFCDPPYHQGFAHKALELLDKGTLLAEDALVIVEHGGDENDLPATTRLRLVKNQRYGKVSQLSFYHLPKQENILAGQEGGASE